MSPHRSTNNPKKIKFHAPSTTPSILPLPPPPPPISATSHWSSTDLDHFPPATCKVERYSPQAGRIAANLHNFTRVNIPLSCFSLAITPILFSASESWQ